jgi:inner membrane protein
MASFGHVAAGLLAARLHGGGKRTGQGESPTGPRRPTPWWALLLFSGLALLPDADVLLVALGACDAGFCGHRGASHSFPAAIAIGILGALIARRLGWPAIRTGVATALAVGSHAVLDLLGEGGRGLPLLWPFTDERFQSPIRIFPDAPRGWAFLSRAGLVNLVTELVFFAPVAVYALWPRIAGWLSARAARQIPQLPSLTFIEGGAIVEGGARIEGGAMVEGAAGLSPAPAAAPATTGETDPPVRSAG